MALGYKGEASCFVGVSDLGDTFCYTPCRDFHEPVMVVVCRDGSSMSRDGRLLVICRSKYVVVLPTMVDPSILMCNKCVCMHLCRLYLDCVVSNKNGSVCVPR
jgi:hypothetical protein